MQVPGDKARESTRFPHQIPSRFHVRLSEAYISLEYDPNTDTSCHGWQREELLSPDGE